VCVCVCVCVCIVISMNRVRIAHKLQNDLTILLVQETYPRSKKGEGFNDAEMFRTVWCA
jgi:hypothetical protein